MPEPGDDRTRARTILRVAVDQAAATGVALPPSLRIWELAEVAPSSSPSSSGLAVPSRPGPGGEPGAGPAGPEALAVVLEQATPEDQRQRHGLHVTPAWLAEELVARGLAQLPTGASSAPTVCDPACGGGAFLLAAAQALAATGVTRVEVVRTHLWGADVDPVGLAAAELALTLWAGEPPPPGRLVVGDALTEGASLWPAAPADGFGMVVGNPPFLNQLERATVRPAATTERLRARLGDVVQPYTDAAWLFLVLACDLTRPGGVVTLVQPLSVVAARDGAAVRAALGERAELRELWVEDQGRRAFAASVHVCAPVLVVGTPVRRSATVAGASATATATAMATATVAEASATATATATAVDATVADATDTAADADAMATVTAAGAAMATAAADDADGDAAAAATRNVDRVWADRLADAVGVPPVVLAARPGAGRLGDRADVAAGFRDEYYGLVPLVHEAMGEPGADAARLVTTGIVDWGHCAWGERPVRFARRSWQAPVVDRQGADDLDPAAPTTRGVRRWLARTAGPKLLVANQTRVVELAVDEVGAWVPSVPTLAVVPHEVEDLWLLAAAAASPAATAWLWRRAPGTALHRDALKVAAGHLADLPLPGDPGAWRAAAAALRGFAAVDGPVPEAAAFEEFVAAAAAAYRSPPELVAWWRARLPAKESTERATVPLV